jgi:uncharacterized membrane protein YcaP (DUF421 family)
MIQVINLFANLITVVSVTFFIIGVFGRRSKMIEQMPMYEQYFLRFALATLASGALLNVLTFSTPHATEVILNLGMGLLFTWAAWFHWKYFVRKK